MANLTAVRPTQPWTAPTATDPVDLGVHLPGSKSITARALVLSALADGPSTLHLPLRARDTELMAAGLRNLGVAVSTNDDNRWVVRPQELRGPARIDVGLAGTVMRFGPPVAGLTDGPVTFDGDPVARTRPLGPLLDGLRALGVRIDAAPTGGLPLTVHGTGRVAGGEVTIDASASSQFVSGLLLAAPRFDRGVVVRHQGPPVPSAPHLRMTTRMLRAAGAAVDDGTPDLWVVEPGRLSGREWEIEPDLSGAVPYFAAALVTGGRVTLRGWPHNSAQPVDQLRTLLHRLGGEVTVDAEGLTVRGTGTVHGIDADLSEIAELTPAVAALAVLADAPSKLRGIAHIRGHETDRLAALARELTGLGADVTETADSLEIRPRPLRGGGFETYHDHRMAHAAAIIGLAVPGVELSDVTCTAKTQPEFPALWSAMVTGD
ncbi:3-phosphoshikimate 1-carboxyvinyltransferase [Polymorphospora rubra]|uniref:3-phosphoshikimate 1-carboxyvinyltransferase n=1 Tax=Polymorphospora rubra TaxID=338584 RepID=A0A810N4X3_9ACTN|nr:3-phosphoshikimate 1-carboxyvinyltransferase [Polymorphospora rubra]BCJ66525.1 3-phosphoshikimate 1-carboxyvinyltransferase 1 [Polymorphospora rubra]